MRELRFRAWCKKENKMYYKPQWLAFNTRTWGFGDGLSGSFDDLILMEWTGLQDKNRKDIYEKDILDRNRNCLWNNGSVIEVVDFKDSKFICGKADLWNIVKAFSPKVIGNIYENPELSE